MPAWRHIVYTVILCTLACASMWALPACVTKPKQPKAPPPIHAPEKVAAEAPLQRGKMVFAGVEYSSTGLTCAHCHSASPAMETGRRFIAHSAYGMVARGAWWITTQQQFDAKLGGAATLGDAANMCISAPYMRGKQQLTADDAKALEAFLTSISDTSAKDSAPFLQQPPAMPAKGLTPNKANGKSLYEQSCVQCHGVIPGIVALHAVKDSFNPVQLMAKIRKQDNWELGNASATYARALPWGLRFAALAGMRSAMAQEAGAGTPPPAAGAAPEGAPADAAAPPLPAGQLFPENAMPGFAADILCDQDVVDIAFYVIEDLAAPEAQP